MTHAHGPSCELCRREVPAVLGPKGLRPCCECDREICPDCVADCEWTPDDGYWAKCRSCCPPNEFERMDQSRRGADRPLCLGGGYGEAGEWPCVLPGGHRGICQPPRTRHRPPQAPTGDEDSELLRWWDENDPIPF